MRSSYQRFLFLPVIGVFILFIAFVSVTEATANVPTAERLPTSQPRTWTVNCDWGWSSRAEFHQVTGGDITVRVTEVYRYAPNQRVFTYIIGVPAGYSQVLLSVDSNAWRIYRVEITGNAGSLWDFASCVDAVPAEPDLAESHSPLYEITLPPSEQE